MDIIERLRGNTDEQLSGWKIVVIMHEAADEIERLREALQELVDWQNGPPLVAYTDGWNNAMEKARAALKESS